MLHTLPRPCSRLQTMPGTGDVLPAACPVPDPAVFREAVARWRALRSLEEFRLRLYGCFTARADALFELADAVLCADHAVTSLVQLCLEPEFTRGHGALYERCPPGGSTTRGSSPCWRRNCRGPWTGRRHSRGSRSTT